VLDALIQAGVIGGGQQGAVGADVTSRRQAQAARATMSDIAIPAHAAPKAPPLPGKAA